MHHIKENIWGAICSYGGNSSYDEQNGIHWQINISVLKI